MKALCDFFSSKSIEYFSVISYADCRETSGEIMSRESFEPRSVILYLLPYYTGECVNISRYAASYDYHLAISEINEELCALLHSEYPDAAVRGYGDHSPIDERHAAIVSGLGVQGQNGLLINEKYGSYVFIADVVTDIDPTLLGARSPMDYRYCDGCGLCKSACPTGVLLSRSCACLSEITQRKGELSHDECELMRRYDTAWGCDECQSSCPHNLSPVKTPIEFFYRDRIDRLTREMLDSMSREELRRRAFGWRGRRVVERNLDILNNKYDTENENA